MNDYVIDHYNLWQLGSSVVVTGWHEIKEDIAFWSLLTIHISFRNIVPLFWATPHSLIKGLELSRSVPGVVVHELPLTDKQ